MNLLLNLKTGILGAELTVYAGKVLYKTYFTSV